MARFGGIVAYTGVNDEAAAQLLAAVESVARTQRPGGPLPDRLSPVAFGVARTVPFGAIAPSANGLLVLLHGPVRADIETPEGEQNLQGKSGPAWVSQVVPGAMPRVRISGSRQPGPPVQPRTDLRDGIVPGGGFVFGPAGMGEPAKAAATERIPSAPASAETVQVARASAPVETSMTPTPVGVLATPDGASYPLDREYAIGRSPLSDDAVQKAAASPIVVPYDPYVSRVHAYITVDRGAVFVRDASTPAGTFIAAPGAPEWTQISTTPTKLEPGWSLRVGEWIATYRAGNS
ncbi:FHA domain-containing protein [Mycobacterium branderi]|uniref:FHA domain-containing protein n=1 Tax=Mycobacterium branderi TaxID=43348 RepID=A0AA91LYP2_9MYCO|nr:FHA domain-containing protein [Mycobacterium branderi]MCV7233765.1 FHA domain-containing protein [Mycobacterium branderi]ORA39690.1 hypothetical protein BST20_09350 [Mycobacterium branderi]